MTKFYLSELSESRLVPFYLTGGWLYETKASTIMADHTWDELCRLIKARWDSIEHRHKKFIDYDALDSATAMGFRKLPTIVRNAALYALATGVYLYD